jgi:acetate kinase
MNGAISVVNSGSSSIKFSLFNSADDTELQLIFRGQVEGIGENAAEIRSRVCAGAQWLGVRLDPEANRAGGPEISAGDSEVTVWVIPANEELMIAAHTRAVLAGHGVDSLN